MYISNSSATLAYTLWANNQTSIIDCSFAKDGD